jgi:transketolase
MRNAFADEITKIAIEDERLVLLSGDIGNKLFDKYKEAAPKRFYNCGIAEGNMMSVAAGLSLSGLRSIVYTITPFTTTRCFEQIRVDVCYHKAPVIIVGTGSGLSYADLGPTHHSLEDMAILRTLPEMSVIAPCDSNELRQALRAALKLDSPVYIRIGKKGEPDIHTNITNFKIGKSIVIKKGEDITLISSGTIISEVLEAAKKLEEKGISVEVVSMHTIKPLDEDYLFKASNKFKMLITIEEHGKIGGLGGAVAEWKSNNDIKITHQIFGTPDEFMHEVGSQKYAREKYGLVADNISNKVYEKYQNL